MNIPEELNGAKVQYERGYYKNAMDACAEILDTQPNGEVIKAACMLMAKACAKRSVEETGGFGEQYLNLINRSIHTATSHAKIIQEVCEMQKELAEVIEDGIGIILQKKLNEMYHNTSLDESRLQAFSALKVSLQLQKYQIRKEFFDNDSFRTLAAAEGLEAAKAFQEYELPVENEVTTEQMDAWTVDTADRIFADARQFFEANNDGTPELVKMTAARTLGKILYASSLYNMTIPHNGEKPTEQQLESLMKLADTYQFLLNACIRYNGNTVSLCAGDRSHWVSKLQNVYLQISRADPTFDAPPIQVEETRRVVQTQNYSGGGCYVATAVYGSYDCPQVWTLRRYRDNTLAQSWYGRLFIHSYYAVSPTLVKWFGDTNWFKNLWRGKLDKMVEKLQAEGVDSTPYQDKKW